MDNEFLALSLVFILLGVTGIVLFSGPPNSLGDSCYCLIPSPEPGAAQGTSSIFLVLGVMFFPMGLLKGGLPSFRRTPKLPVPGGKVLAPVQIESWNYFIFGLAVLLVGVDVVLVPGYLVYRNSFYELSGLLLTAAGVLSMVWGIKKPKSQKAE